MANKQVGNIHGVVAVRGSGNETQTIKSTGATEGVFRLQFAGLETANLVYNPTAAEVETAVRALANVSATGVAVSGGPLGPTGAVANTDGSRTSNVVTLTGLPTGHPFRVGHLVIVDVADATYDGAFTITAVGANSLSYAQVAGDDASSGAGLTVIVAVPLVVTFQNEFASTEVPRLVVNNVSLVGGSITVEDTTDVVPFFDADMASITAMRARLTAIDGTTYSSAYLNKMTMNDMVYALRHHDSPLTIR